ncbi:MAG: Zn-ribbon domain-containing OB-fold protein [Deltaproteobacteria bacterium]|nr:Zn-ribbon domain-containing OB-fold protein [Deltaproteobacteria bacterium]
MEEKQDLYILEDEVAIPYENVYGPVWTRFFEGLVEKKIYGSRCSRCNRVLVPARSFCPRCFVETDDITEVSQEGAIVSWVLTDYEYFGMPTKPPFIGALIRLDGTDSSFLHLVGGFDLRDADLVRKTVKNGMKVRAVWKEERKGHILDIKYFEPVQ